MRDILFKAQRLDNKEWVEGYYVKIHGTNLHYIATGKLEIKNGRLALEVFEIEPETLCQYTGLNDMTSNKIWENDIVQDTEGCIGKVLFGQYQWQVEIIKSKYILSLGQTFPLWQWDECERNGFRKLEVIGNVFDNPELLEGKE